jgi:hypothetical protein
MAVASYNAPGPSGLVRAAWKWCWELFDEEIFRVFAAAIEIGYHPKLFHDSITVVIQKPNKPDYTARGSRDCRI